MFPLVFPTHKGINGGYANQCLTQALWSPLEMHHNKQGREQIPPWALRELIKKKAIFFEISASLQVMISSLDVVQQHHVP